MDLRLARRKAGLTQGDIAYLMNCHQSLITRLERGIRQPTLEQIVDLSLIYGRSFEAFFESLMTDRQIRLRDRLTCLPTVVRKTSHTTNRTCSLRRLRKRLAQPHSYGYA